ncbi:MAG: endonuclease/exonuclease/phosphatase family protein [Planctomycetota bacterium]
MKVLTYNIWDGGVNEIGGDRQKKILSVLGDARPDIVALQEASGFDREERDTLAAWAKKLGMEGRLARAPTGYHVAVLARPPMKFLSAEAIHPALFTNACLSARLESPAGEVIVFAVHLNPFDPDARLTEARHVARSAYAEHPVLLMGDFNSFSPRDTVDASVRKLSRRVLARFIAAQEPAVGEDPPFDTRAIGILEWAGFVDVFRRLHPAEPGCTLPTRCPRPRESAQMRLDYIFATEALVERAEKCEVIRTPASDFGSDHCPLAAEFRL